VGAEREAIKAAIADALAAPLGWPRPERWDDQVAARVVEALHGGIVPLEGQ
jgi:hypothetical protein